LRRFLGQVIGQTIPVECSTHCPHIWQPNRGRLMISSTGLNKRSKPLTNRGRRPRYILIFVQLLPGMFDLFSNSVANCAFWLAAVQLLAPVDEYTPRRAVFQDGIRSEPHFPQLDLVAKLPGDLSD
jgi:hypothetical protein